MTKPFSHIPLPAERSRTKPGALTTPMMDWGLPFGQQEDWLDLLAPVVDLAKLVVGTARLLAASSIASHGVRPFLGQFRTPPRAWTA